MKLLVFSLLLPLFANAHQEQEVSARTPVASTAPQQPAEATSLVLYDVRDIADSLGVMYDDAKEDDNKAQRSPQDSQDRRFIETRPVATMTRFEWKPDGEVTTTQQVDPEREGRITRNVPELADVIRRNIEPAFDAHLHSINVAGPATLAVVATAKQHDWIKRFLTLAQRSTTDLIRVDTRWITGAAGSFEKLGLTGVSMLPNEKEFAALLGMLEADRNGADLFNQLIAPSLVMRNLQRASIRTSDEIAYVKEWRVAFVQPGPQQIADPVIETINAGETLKLRAVRVDENLYRLSLDIEHVDVAQPIPTKKVRVSVAPGGEAEIGLPVVTRVNFTADLLLAGGGAAVLVTPLNDKQDLALIIKLSSVPNQTPAELPPARK